MLTMPSLVPSVLAATTATAASSKSQMIDLIARWARSAAGRCCGQRGERVVGARHLGVARLCHHLSQQLAGDRVPTRRAVEIFVECRLRRLQVALRSVELTTQQGNAGVEHAQLEVLSHEE